MSSEAYIQASVVNYARKKGVLARKLDFGQGYPDYLLLYSGCVLFIEFKATNGKLSVLQEHVIKVIREQDFTVEVCDSVAFGEKVVDQLVIRGILLRQRKAP